MAKYVDGFVLTVPKKNVNKYKKMAKDASKAWKKFGALEYFECMGDDLKPKSQDCGENMPQPRLFGEMANAKPDETVWFSFIVYKSRAHRDSVNKKVMAYFAKKYVGKEDMSMPFDVKKMAYAGFKAMVEA